MRMMLMLIMMMRNKMMMMRINMRMTGVFPLQTRRAKMKLTQMSMMDIGSADLALLDQT